MRISISDPKSSPAALRRLIQREAQAIGFAAMGVTTPGRLGDPGAGLRAYVANGYHGSMDWMAETLERRSAPQAIWPEVRSIVVLAMNYGQNENLADALAKPECGAVSVYARNRDYHEIIKGKLKQIAGKLAARSGEDVKVFVDTAPVMEKPLGQAAGVGWQGKHTNLVSRDLGSWFFLGSIFTTADLEADEAEADHCGSCRACLDSCPTDAFPAPYQLDARRCISYLTIELKEPIPREFRAAIGNRVYGCDDCLAACPWNKFAQVASEAKLIARDDLNQPLLQNLLALDDAAFRAFFTASPVKRIGRDRFIRNCLIAAGNSRDVRLVEQCRSLLADSSPLVRGAAVWALGRLLGYDELASLAAGRDEPDAGVQAEWRASLAGNGSC